MREKILPIPPLKKKQGGISPDIFRKARNVCSFDPSEKEISEHQENAKTVYREKRGRTS
jgi:hypothetical protein